MIRAWTELRTLATLRRIALALEKANELREKETARPRKSKIVDFGVGDPEEWNKRWHEEQVAMGREE